jgi:poly(3-hydroxybutyrate) depolymerase
MRTFALMMTILLFFCLSIKAQEKQTVKINNITRTYLLHLPDNMKKNAPLVFVLHGYEGLPAQRVRDG